MKKVLSGLFAILISTTNGRCDTLTPIGYEFDSNELSKTISLNAVLAAFQEAAGKCNQLDTQKKNKISNILYTLSSTDMRQITVKGVIDSCLSVTGDFFQCYNCLEDIITKHNAIVHIKSTPNTKYTSKAQYDKELQIRGICTYKNVGSKRGFISKYSNFDIDPIEKCRKIAIQHACRIDKIYVYTPDHDTYTYECGPGGIVTGLYPKDTFDKTINFIPTWEDYKKLYNIK